MKWTRTRNVTPKANKSVNTDILAEGARLPMVRRLPSR